MSDVLPRLCEEKKNPSAGFANDSRRIQAKNRGACVCEKASIVCCVKKCVHARTRTHFRRTPVGVSSPAASCVPCQGREPEEEGEQEGEEEGGEVWERVQRALYCSHGDLSRGLLPTPPTSKQRGRTPG